MRLITREAWGARAPRRTLTPLQSTQGVKVHYTGDEVDPRIRTDHDRCEGRVRAIQAWHMDHEDYSDIGYTAVVCPHGYVLVGRGPRILPAANGPGLNAGHYAVCGLVGSSGLTTPTDAMLDGIRDAITWLRREGGAGDEIRGHRDGYPTSCPGEALYTWVRNGAPRPGAPADTGGTMDRDDVQQIADAVVARTLGPVHGRTDKEPVGSIVVGTAGDVRQVLAEMALLRAELAAVPARVAKELAARLDG